VDNPAAELKPLEAGNRSYGRCNLNIAAILKYTPEQAATSLRQTLSTKDRVDVRELAKGLGCRVASMQISASRTVQADLSPDSGRDLFYLRVDPEPAAGWGEVNRSSREETARHRLRFRVAHELGHTFFYRRQKGRGPRRLHRWSSREEEWCDEFARSLLVPTTVVATMPATARSVFSLQRRFDVSLEVAARALADAHKDATVALWYWPTGASEPQESLLRQWASCGAAELRHWRRSNVVAEALAGSESEGPLVSLSRPRRQLAATVRSGRRRRQVLLVAK
jgi:hypothetical protein